MKILTHVACDSRLFSAVAGSKNASEPGSICNKFLSSQCTFQRAPANFCPLPQSRSYGANCQEPVAWILTRKCAEKTFQGHFCQRIHSIIVGLRTNVGQVPAIAAGEVPSSGRQIQFCYSPSARSSPMERRAEKPAPNPTKMTRSVGQTHGK